MTAKDVTRIYTIPGFKINEMIGNKYKKNPDFNKILSTCHKNPTNLELYELCTDSSAYIFNKKISQR